MEDGHRDSVPESSADSRPSGSHEAHPELGVLTLVKGAGVKRNKRHAKGRKQGVLEAKCGWEGKQPTGPKPLYTFRKARTWA